MRRDLGQLSNPPAGHREVPRLCWGWHWHRQHLNPQHNSPQPRSELIPPCAQSCWPLEVFPSLQKELDPEPEQLDKHSARSGAHAVPARRQWSPAPSCPRYLLGLSLPLNSFCQLCPLLPLESKWDALQGATVAQDTPSHGVPTHIRVSSAAPFKSCLQSSAISL